MRYLKSCIILLAIFACTAFVFMTIRNRAEIREMENESAAAKAFEKQQTEQSVADKQPPREARDGHSHGDHSHEKLGQSDTPTQPVTTYKDNGEYIEIDYSFLDNPEEAIRRHAEIVLNREKYSSAEYDKALQEASVLSRKMLDGYYGKGEYFEELWKFRDEVYTDPMLKKQGLSIEKLDAMIRGEIPPMVVPIDPAVLKVDTNKGGDK